MIGRRVLWLYAVSEKRVPLKSFRSSHTSNAFLINGNDSSTPSSWRLLYVKRLHLFCSDCFFPNAQKLNLYQIKTGNESFMGAAQKKIWLKRRDELFSKAIWQLCNWVFYFSFLSLQMCTNVVLCVRIFSLQIENDCVLCVWVPQST